MGHYLEYLFNPQSIAVIGASDKENSVGMIVFKNLLKGGYKGKLYPINPKYNFVQDQTCLASVEEVDHRIDLVLIAVPANRVMDVLIQCGKKCVRHAIIFSAGFKESGKEGACLEEAIREISRQYNIRILGPNCLGILLPHLKINATFTHIKTLAGSMALVSQSGGICTGILDWAVAQRIGFSAMVSLGNAVDIDFGDILDYLALDSHTQSILLYIESIHNIRSFMMSLRAVSRIKPIIVIKAGRHQKGINAVLTHTGAMIGSDDVFNTALRRAGAVRVKNIEQLFSAAAILSKKFQLKNEDLVVITNGGGIGVMAADFAQDINIPLSSLSDGTIKYLNGFLPHYWSHGNPVDILGDATPERYEKVIRACINDEHVAGVLVILVPVVMSNPFQVAQQLISISKCTDKPILTCWLGESQIKKSRKLFLENHVPCFNTPESAIDAFSYLVDYYHNQKLLSQMTECTFQNKHDVHIAKKIIEKALSENRKVLSLYESKSILKIFEIPITPAVEVCSEDEAVLASKSMGFPIVMKIWSSDITHKQEVHGVQLNISNEEGVRSAFNLIIKEAKYLNSNAIIKGVTIEPMHKEANDRELMVGIFTDPLFGPVIAFGSGGSNVEVMQDKAIALPPLNKFIARHLISKTRVRKLLGPFRNMPAVNFDEVENVLLNISEMICKLPEIIEMDINPLIANEYGVIAVDARIVVEHAKSEIPYNHMAIHPESK